MTERLVRLLIGGVVVALIWHFGKGESWGDTLVGLSMWLVVMSLWLVVDDRYRRRTESR
ncbi:hypothetical protein ACH4S8_41485 [Streptomyces sp. NPDC021080]|uniref:hypothetical protein n=1 Tax=Streptomyces sp. NPDC021080 TaxID=3365110 RepID=UPI0037A8DF45